MADLLSISQRKEVLENRVKVSLAKNILKDGLCNFTINILLETPAPKQYSVRPIAIDPYNTELTLRKLLRHSVKLRTGTDTARRTQHISIYPSEIKDCFMCSAEEIDCIEILDVIRHHSAFRKHLTNVPDGTDPISMTRSHLMKIQCKYDTLEISDHELETCIGLMIAILEDQKELLNRREAQEAVQKLVKLLETVPTFAALSDVSLEKNVQQTICEDDKWGGCIQNKDMTQGRRLLRAGNLPNQEELDGMCQDRVFGRKSDITLQACKKICIYIKKLDKNILDVWPGRDAKVPEMSEPIQCTFILVVKGDIDMNVTSKINYKFTIRKPVKAYVKHQHDAANEAPLFSFKLEELQKVKQCLHKYTDILMERHKLLTMVTASPYRCTDKISSLKRNKEICIALYVQVKGYMPVDEEPFERQYDGIDVDVREGCFYPFSANADEYQELLKMGCKISGEKDGGKSPKGTLGGFIDHPKHSVCGITCAHCVMTPVEMKQIAGENKTLDTEYPFLSDITSQDGNDYHGNVYQPDQTRKKIGVLVKAVCRKGGETPGESGIDLAVFQICDRFPKVGEFPVDENGDTLNYMSGKIAGFPRPTWRDETIVKFGYKTGLTSGKLESEIPLLSVRQTLKWTYGDDNSKFKIQLYNQLEFNSNDEQQFADYGDSGALVFSDRQNGEDLLCVGMVVGGKYDITEGRISFVVTPIMPILKELDVAGFKNFETDQMKVDIKEIKENTKDFQEMKTDIRDIKKLLQGQSWRNTCEII